MTTSVSNFAAEESASALHKADCDQPGLRKVEPCGCQRCYDERLELAIAGAASGEVWLPVIGYSLRCELCGEKGCPHHVDHRYGCDGYVDPLGLVARISEDQFREQLAAKDAEIARLKSNMRAAADQFDTQSAKLKIATDALEYYVGKETLSVPEWWDYAGMSGGPDANQLVKEDIGGAAEEALAEIRKP